MKHFGLFVFAFLLLVFKSCIVTKLWGWFVVPFFEMKPLPIAYAIGFLLIISIVKGKVNINKELDDKDIAVDIGVSLTVPLVYLFFGWIIHSLFM